MRKLQTKTKLSSMMFTFMAAIALCFIFSDYAYAATEKTFYAKDGATETYSTTGDSLVIPYVVEQGKVAHIKAEISGYTDRKNTYFSTFDKNDNLENVSSIPASGVTGTYQGGEKEVAGSITIVKASAEQGNGVELTVKLSCDLLNLTNSGKEVAPGEEIFVAQMPEELYWQFTIDETSKVSFPEEIGAPNSICDENKKEITSAATSRVCYLEKGTYYFLTKNYNYDKGEAGIVRFSYNVEAVGNDADKNTSLEKAKDIKTNKEIKGLQIGYAEDVVSYYKFKLSNKKKIQISFTDVYKIEILDSEGESVAHWVNVNSKEKGKVKFTWFEVKGKNLYSHKAKKLPLDKGTYYIAVEGCSDAQYSIKLKG